MLAADLAAVGLGVDPETAVQAARNAAENNQLDSVNSAIRTALITGDVNKLESMLQVCTDAKEIEALKRALDYVKFRQQFVGSGINKAAQELGFDKQVKGADFDSHGQKVFTDGKRFISKDWDGHSGGIWKMYDKSGKVREGTYDRYLNRIKK
jgi:hypothetical protein